MFKMFPENTLFSQTNSNITVSKNLKFGFVEKITMGMLYFISFNIQAIKYIYF